MPIQQTYKTGTITVVSGSATVTGTSTFWSAGLVNGGELSFKGFSIPIIAVGSDTSLTVDYAAPAAMAGTGAYSISLGRADAASAIVAVRLLADLTDLLRSKVSPFAATILDDLSAAAVRQTIGAITASDIPAEISAAAILTKLLTVDGDTAGINATTLKSVAPSTFGLSILDDPDASAAQATLGISAFIKTILDDADAATARATLLAASAAEYSVVSGAPVTPNARFMMAQGSSGTGFRPLTVRTSRGMVLQSDSLHVVVPVSGTYLIVFGVAGSVGGLCTGVMTVNGVSSGSSTTAAASSTSSGGDFRQLTAGDIVSVSVSASGVAGSTFLQMVLV